MKVKVNVNGSGGFKNKTEIVGSEVEKDGVRGRKKGGQRSKKMGSEVEKVGNADAWARRPYRKKDGVRGFSCVNVKVNVNGG